MSDLARLEIYLGNTASALSLIELAQIRSDQIPATVCAMLCALRAQLFAGQHRYSEALSEVHRADEQFAARKMAADPPWISYYDEAEHQGSTARALVPWAITRRDLRIAAPRLREAIRLHDNDHRRSRTFSRTRLASLTMKIGDPREAAAMGHAALEEASTLHSARLNGEIDNLGSLTLPHANIPEVAELRDGIAAMADRSGRR